ncbi:adenosine deaminase [Anaerolineales bacterium]
MNLKTFIEQMPKVELHVHLEGATQPATLLELAIKNGVQLPYDSVEGLQKWYEFRDFDHFIEIYLSISDCIQSADDIEWLAKEFLIGQAVQNICYSEVTYTPLTHYLQHNIPFEDQLAALNRARAWAIQELGVDMGIVLDIPRHRSPEEGILCAEWAISAYGRGVVAFGLGGAEIGNPPAKFQEAFNMTNAAGIPSVPHAGETEGPASIWSAIKDLQAVRIGHGVRCLEDPELVDYIREEGIVLEVNPSSNICLGVYKDFESHPMAQLMEAGLKVTLNSDDPPMFNTTLTNEYIKASQTWGWDESTLEKLVFEALNASFLPEWQKENWCDEFSKQFQQLKA